MARFLDATHPSSSLRSQQALVDVAFRGPSSSSLWPRRFSPRHSLNRSPPRGARNLGWSKYSRLVIKFFLSPVPFPLLSYSLTSIWGLALSAAVTDVQMKDAIEPTFSEPRFYSRLFVTPKVTGGWRPIIDLSRLNRFVRLSPFRMETSLSVLQSLCPGDWMVSIDLQDAYRQVPVHPESRRYLRFSVSRQTYQFRVFCFGVSTAPQVFTRVMTPISSIMHRFGYRILRYLDDWLILGSSFQEITRARDFLLWLCQELGVLVNLSKSSFLARFCWGFAR